VTLENVRVDFEMRYDRWLRRLLTVFGVGPKGTMIRVADGTLHVKFGRVFRMDIPVKDIKSARPLGERRRLIVWAIGVHQAGDGWLINGSRVGVVELTFHCPVEPKKVPMAPFSADPSAPSTSVSLNRKNSLRR
jgi:hypothetical protein